jgi:RNA polymerase sigma-70 factor (ECF subfamily)
MVTESLLAEKELEVSQSIEEIYERHVSMIYRVSFSYVKNTADAEDISSEVFAKLIRAGVKFKSAEHEKAWLLRTAINLCKNNLKHWRRKNENIDDYINLHNKNHEDETLQAVMELPERYKYAVYLYYYEGYSSEEIARMLKKPRSTVLNHLHEARKILKGVLGNEK